MSGRRILLIGYYGKGNFGDDVLLKTSYGILKTAMPDAQISVVADGDTGGYVPAMLGEATVLQPGRHGQFDLIVHGGGGVYFDFEMHALHNRALEKLIECASYPLYVALEKLARFVAGKMRSSAKIRLGFGIGVGTYTPGSPRLRASLPIIATYDALWVRDAESAENLGRFASVFNGQLIRGSDLAFLTQYWMPPVAPRGQSTRPKLGIILRDWPEKRGGLPAETLREAVANLAREYDVTGFVFDEQADPVVRTILTPYATVLWQPHRMSIAEFTHALAQQDVLLTSRAHGAICGACVGVPSVIVAIEPKLRQVATMLRGACEVVAADAPETWGAALTKARGIAPQAVASAVETNRAASADALGKMQRWLT